MSYIASEKRYEGMKYNRTGKSGLKLSAISLGLWHNFGSINSFEQSRNLAKYAFDLGITHFDLANNYGPAPGSAEETFGKILKTDFAAYRDELIISTKAGYYMWPGPYGEWGSKKYLVASLNQSLKRLGLDYVDIFYHHRPDPDTPLEETMEALDHIVRQGKALYVGISNYNPDQTKQAAEILKKLGTPFIIHQMKYSMFQRDFEKGLSEELETQGLGSIAFSPLAQGMLTDKYLSGIPKDSRAAGPSVFLSENSLTEEVLSKIKALNEVAKHRDQSLAQLALAWVLRDGHVTSALIGASKESQIRDCVDALKNTEFTNLELDRIDEILNS